MDKEDTKFVPRFTHQRTAFTFIFSASSAFLGFLIYLILELLDRSFLFSVENSWPLIGAGAALLLAVATTIIGITQCNGIIVRFYSEKLHSGKARKLLNPDQVASLLNMVSNFAFGLGIALAAVWIFLVFWLLLTKGG